ncbi:NIBAN protein, partial [Rhinopomastus cyanomelas]|nr:NIBAN protein [Rhinopomastus cyanomelas]
ATVSEPAQKCCTENIQPFLASILEELMGPVSSGFAEVRLLFDKEVNEITQDFQKTNDVEKLKEKVDELLNLPFNSVKMEPCYLKVNLLQELLQDLKSRFKVYHIDFVIQRTQNFMQELMENAVYTFEQLLSPSHQTDSAKVASTIEKVKLRVLK